MVAMIGVMLLLRMVLVMGVSTYMNAEANKEDGNLEVVALYYQLQAKTGDFMEPYLAYYNAGTALAKNNQPDQAERLLEMSLAKVDNVNNECYVRGNLAAVQKQLGDYYMIADKPESAESYYAKAITTISESPAICFPPPPQGGGNSDGNQEGEQKEDPNGDPLTPQDDEPNDTEQGEKMKDTEKQAKEGEKEAKDAQGDSVDGKDQVEREMDKSKSEMDNQEDISNQKESSENSEQNSDKPQVDKPW